MNADILDILGFPISVKDASLGIRCSFSPLLPASSLFPPSSSFLALGGAGTPCGCLPWGSPFLLASLLGASSLLPWLRSKGAIPPIPLSALLAAWLTTEPPVCCDARRLAPLPPVTNPPQAPSLMGSSSLRTFFPDGSSSLLVSLPDSLGLTPQLPTCLAGGRIDNGAHRLLRRQCTGSSVLWHRFSIAPLSWRRQL